MWTAIAIAVVQAYVEYASSMPCPDERHPDDWQRWRMEQQQRAEIEARKTRRQALLGTALLLALAVSAIWMMWEMWG